MTSDRSTRARLALERDAAFRRLGRARGWAFTGAAALTAGFAALVWALAPGHSLSSASAATTAGHAASSAPASASSSKTAQMPSPADASALGLQGSSVGPVAPAAAPPSSAAAPTPSPQVAPTPAPAVSGGS